ncbi:hypothetical protein EEL30_11670 [Brevibacillus laterosporus]|uniref:Uncharacterized protein n=1 Tax=Brevibacillus laterosporus TaxID=1465 RepID=A0A518V7C9_BRELA|nr:hypothetical protein EEL30_11670 [Brevibacillus laterosporus]
MKMNSIGKIAGVTTVFALVVSANVITAKQSDESEIQVLKDAVGGSVLSNMPGEVWVTDEEEKKQIQFLEENLEPDKKVGKSQNVDALAPRYDVENNPILIGKNWNKDDCGKNAWTTYARHTIGDKDSASGDGDYLTTYGEASWYNSNGNIALPYRNGSSNTGQNTVDVKNGVTFSVRDINSNKSMTVKRTDFGPNQCPNSRYTKVIVDLDTSTFKDLHGNTSDGVFYSRTWVPLTNWNPS